MKRSYLWVSAIAAFAICAGQAQAEAALSPDKRNQIEVTLGAQGPVFSVNRDGKSVITPSPMGLMLGGNPPFGTAIGAGGFRLTSETTRAGADVFTLPAGKVTAVNAPYTERELTFETDTGTVRVFKIIIRAYDDGVAFRYVVPAQAGVTDLVIQREATVFHFAADYDCWGLNQGRFVNSFEGEYDHVKASEMRNFNLFQSPLVCKTGEGETTFALVESNLKNYAGAWYAARGDGGLGVEVHLSPRFDTNPSARFNTTAAKVDASKGFETPWRVVMMGDSAGKLIENNLITALAEPSMVTDTSWIKPGLVAWDWWNGSQVVLPEGQSAGMNTATYKAFTDFAADLGLEYILIDEGWSIGSTVEPNDAADITKPKPEMDMAEIIRYAKSKGVKVWVWVQWQQMDNQMQAALETYEKWGIAGIKIDFMNRNDQEMVDYYHRLLTLSAKHKIMVDLHGAYPPNGLIRTYPHYLTQEGILGAENNKWSRRITASHNVKMAYTRMLAGPVDYTPGGFRHVTPEDFPSKQSFINPVVMTTRGQALGMYVVYDSPLQMVSDAPAAYKKADGTWEDGVDFLKIVPATWDETRFIKGDIEDYIVIARRSGKDWYIGAMTNEEGREVTVPLDFLGEGTYGAKVWQDGATISTLTTSESKTAKGQSLTLTLAPRGGAVAVLTSETKAKKKKAK